MWTVRVAVGTCLLVLAACGARESYGSLAPPAPGTASPDATAAHPTAPDATAPGATAPGPPDSAGGTPSPSVDSTVVAQYARFWTQALPAAAAAPAGRRRAVLAPVTAEPELSHLVRALAALDADGQRTYGSDVPVAQTVRVSGALALVEGCLDSSRSGVADAATGAPVTRGVARNAVRVDLTRGPDGYWRVSAVTYPAGATC